MPHPFLFVIRVMECDFFSDIVTSSLVPVRPFNPSTSEPTLEVDELSSLSTTEQHINTEYINHCYVYPKFLNYDNQKSFAKVS